MDMTLEDIWRGIAELVPSFVAALPVAALVVLGGVLLNIIIGRSFSLLARRTQLEESDIVPARNALRWLVRVVVFVIVLGVFGFELGGIWAMISTILAMVAIGFVAVWSLLSHTSATVILVLIRPFSIGDDIKLPSENVEGRVVDLNFFFTTLVDHEGSEWRVPNNLFFQKVMLRKKGEKAGTLAAQLNNSRPAKVEPPPPPAGKTDEDSEKKPKSAAKDNAPHQMPDPDTVTAPRR